MIERIKDYLEPKTRKVTYALWDDEDQFLKASQSFIKEGYKKIEAVTPYPVHHLDHILELKRSNIPWVTLVFGLLGFGFGAWLTWWTSVVSWPINVGGKPMWSLAAFIPIIFELTILFAALSSVGALIVLCGLPRLSPPILDPALTSHSFALMVYEDDPRYDEQKITEFFKSQGALSVSKGDF